MSTTMFVPSGQNAGSSSSLESSQPCHLLTFAEIQLATQNFDESLVIGHGGFGKVYKGTITYRASLLTVAIKRLDSTSNQGAIEFWAEVKMLSKLRHCHLVSLIGYCDDGLEKILVYEYMPHGTLEDHLHKSRAPLSWLRRLKICIGAARGLDYLHTGTGINHGVIHRDVKSSNILLDNNLAAKISDFGLSKIGPTNQPATYVNTLIRGTFGYIDPGYFQTGRLTRKSDVYAFGVILFEVLCGKQAVDRSLDEEQWGLATWAQDSIKEGRVKQIMDPNIRGMISPKCLKEFARLADRCLNIHPKKRPTMAEVVVGLESILVLQEKTNSLQNAGMTIFGRKLPTFDLTSNVENSVGGRSLKSMELYLDTILGENHIFRRFDYDIIKVATENFSEANKLPRDWFGSAYKGRLHNGQDIAVVQSNSDDANENEQLMKAASMLVKLEHENLVKFGYCIERTRVFLVYEFASRGSLDQLLYDPTCTVLLDWNRRYKIILGVARALVYLHKDAPIRIIHGEVVPSNILLDESFNPKLSGFMLAKAVNETDCIHDDAVRGNIGYIAPEYMSGELSTKADVYSFGNIILNILTGQRSNHLARLANDGDVMLVDYVRKNYLQRTYSNIIDPRIEVESYSMTRFIKIGLLCAEANPRDRPTMEEVVVMLLDYSFTPLIVSEMPTSMIGEPLGLDIEGSLVEDYDTGTAEEFISELCPR